MPEARAKDRFALLAFAGLGETAVRELGLNEGARVVTRLRNYDLVTFVPDDEQKARLARLRTVEDVFLLMGKPAQVQRNADLSRLTGPLNRTSVLRGLDIKNRLFSPGKPRHVTFNCFVKQDQDRNVRRHDIERAVMGKIAATFPRWKIADPASVEFWAFALDRGVCLGLRLSDRSLRYHGQKPAERKGALRPTIAAALVTHASIASGDTVIDPMCGTGTILREIRARHPDVTLLGGDVDRAALLQNSAASVATWDARQLPLRDGSIDGILCNLPFGRQYSDPGGLRGLYRDCLVEWQRILAPGGRMTLMTAESGLLQGLLHKAGCDVQARCKVKILGTWATIHTARRRYA